MKKRIQVLLLTLTFVFAIIPNITYAEAPIYILAASDFQARDSEIPAENDVQSARNMSNILDKIESQGGYTTFNGLFFCGDYNQSTAVADASAGLAKIDELMDERSYARNTF